MPEKRDAAYEFYGWNSIEDEFMDYMIASGEIDQPFGEESSPQFGAKRARARPPCSTDPGSIWLSIWRNILITIGCVLFIVIIVLLYSSVKASVFVV